MCCQLKLVYEKILDSKNEKSFCVPSCVLNVSRA